MTDEPGTAESRLSLTQARDLTQCFGRHRFQSLDYALHYCLQCRKLKSCVRASWRMDQPRPWRKDDWWPEAASPHAGRGKTRPRTRVTPVNIS